jgi:hypothetical protein
MNFIVGILLATGLSENESFWVLVQIVEKYMPIDYFSVMSGVMVDQEILTFLIKMKLSKMYAHMVSLDVDPSHFSVQWFVCMFAYNLRREVIVRLWDIFFLEGCTFIFKIAMAIMKMAEKPMLALKDPCKLYVDEAISFMDKFTKLIKSHSTILMTIKRSDLNLTDCKLSLLRRRFRPNIDSEVDSKLKSVIQAISRDDKDFVKSLKTPCKNYDECRYKSRRTCSYFLFNSSGIQILDDYIDSDSLVPYFNTSHLRESIPATILGHKNHICSFESPVSISRFLPSEAEKTADSSV